MSIWHDFNERRTKGNEYIMDENFLQFKRFFSLDTLAYGEGEIPSKYKELMGLACSLILRCNDCVLYHINKCHELNCSKKELDEAMNIALVIGGSIVIPHLRFALQAINELYCISDELDKYGE